MPYLIHTSKSHTLEPTSGFLSELSKHFSYTKLPWTFYEKKLLSKFPTLLSSGMPELPQECLLPGTLHRTDSRLTDRTQQRIYTGNDALFRSTGLVIPSQPSHPFSLIIHCQWPLLSPPQEA